VEYVFFGFLVSGLGLGLVRLDPEPVFELDNQHRFDNIGVRGIQLTYDSN
jgi:hypothetical protein